MTRDDGWRNGVRRHPPLSRRDIDRLRQSEVRTRPLRRGTAALGLVAGVALVTLALAAVLVLAAVYVAFVVVAAVVLWVVRAIVY